MACHNRECLGSYDFEQIAFFARKRFVEGCSTVALLEQAKSDCEREEIALVSLLDVSDDKLRDLRLGCKYSRQCKVMDCRDRLRRMIEEELARRQSVPSRDGSLRRGPLRGCQQWLERACRYLVSRKLPPPSRTSIKATPPA